MNGEFLLDTNIVIALFAEDENVSQNFAAAAEILIPVIVVGELLHGARISVASKRICTAPKILQKPTAC